MTTSRALGRLLPAALAAALASTLWVQSTASADGLAHCRTPYKPAAGTGWVEYEGTASCASGDTTGLATIKANLLLRQGNGARFKPDTWYTIDSTGYSAWFPYNGSRFRGGQESCSDVPYTGDFQSRFTYQLHWVDDHQTQHSWTSGSVDSKC